MRRVTTARGEAERRMRILPQRVSVADVMRELKQPAPPAAGPLGVQTVDNGDVPASAAGSGAPAAASSSPASSAAASGAATSGASAAPAVQWPPAVHFAVGGAALGPVAWDSATSPHLVAIGQSGAGVTETLRTIAMQLSLLVREAGADVAAEEPAAVVLITDTRRGLIGCPGYLNREDFSTHLRTWVERLRQRIPGDVTPQQLAERSWWQGPEVFVIVDDSDNDPGLDVLAPVLPYAADIGLHVVLGRRSGLFTRNSYQPLMQTIRDQTAWVVLSAPREDGPIAGQRLERRDPGRAVFVQGEASMVQVALWEDNPVATTSGEMSR